MVVLGRFLQQDFNFFSVPCLFVVVLSLHWSDDGRQLALFLLSGGPWGEEVRPQRRQAGVRPLPHQVLRQLLRRVPPTHPCGIKGACYEQLSFLCMHFLSALSSLTALPLCFPPTHLPSNSPCSFLPSGAQP